MSDPGRNIFAIFIFFNFFLCGSRAFAQEHHVADTVQLGEVEVFAGRLPVFPSEMIRLQDTAGILVRDLGDFLRNEPNVSGIRKGGIAIDPVVRGFRFSQVSVILDNGINIEGGCPNRMDPVASHVESEDVNTVEMIKGPYVLKYGPVMGALLNLQRSQPSFFAKPGIRGRFLYGFETNWNGQREHAELEGGNRYVAIRASGGFKGYGSYLSGGGELFNTSFSKSYLTTSAAVKVAEGQKISLGYAYDQGNNVLYPALPMDERLDATNIASLGYQASDLGKTFTSLEVRGYFSSVHHVMDNYRRPSAVTMKAVTTVDAKTTGGKAVTGISAGKSNITAGIDFQHIFKNGQKQMAMTMIMNGDTFTSVKYFNVFNHAVWNNAGIFGEYTSTFGKINFTSSLRMDFNQANSADTFRLVKDGVSYFDKLNSSFLNLSLNAGIKTRLATGLYLTFSAGLGTRSPSVLERFIKLMPVQYDSYDYLGNPQLRPEQNYQADLSLDYCLQHAGSFTSSGFFSLIHDYILGKVLPPSVIHPSTQGAPGVKQFSNVDRVYLYGFEFIYTSPEPKKWKLVASAAATWGTNPDAAKYIVTSGQVTGEETIKNDPLPEIPPLEGNIRFSYGFFRNRLIPAVMVRMVAAQNRISAAYGENTTPGFATASVAVSYLPCRFFTLNAGISNLFDADYCEHLNRRIVGSTESLYEPGRVFNLNVSVQF